MRNTLRCTEIAEKPLKKYVVIVQWDQQLREFYTFGHEASLGDNHSLVIFLNEEVIAEYQDWKMWYIAPEKSVPSVQIEESTSSSASES